MQRNTLYIVLAVVVLVLLGAWLYMRPAASPAGTSTSAPTTPLGSAMQTGDTVKSAVPGAVGKTNPFQSNMNPVGGYQNPFGQ